jgi:hypothetical protein
LKKPAKCQRKKRAPRVKDRASKAIQVSTLRGGAAAAWRRQQVRAMLSMVPRQEAPAAPREGELAAMAKAILHQDLQKPPKTIRERLALCRTGLECDGVIGPRSSELPLHQHNSLPPVVQKMLEDKMREIQAAQEGRAIDGAIVSKGPPAGEEPV